VLDTATLAARKENRKPLGATYSTQRAAEVGGSSPPRPTNNFQFWAIAIASSASGHVKGPTPETC
jgi:hypothetical protein